MVSRLFIIDGHALIFKMYYAFLRRPMINSKGLDTSILFGFTKYVLELIEKEKPTHLAVSFDPPGGTFRNDLYPEYKANRGETPQLVIDALEPLTEICKAMNIPVFMVPGFEADDVIGTLATKLAGPEVDVYMVTPDKDYGQLIADHIWQLKPGRAGEDNELVGIQEINDRYGINSPEQVIDMLTICGDSADNVPGVNGIGEVWAGKLISTYGSVESIYDHINELTDKQQLMFNAAKDHIALSKQLVTIKTDVPVKAALKEMALDMNFNPSIADLFEKYEFLSLKKYISHIGKSAKGTRPSANHYKTVEFKETDAHDVVFKVCSSAKCAFCFHDSELTVATIYKGEYYVGSSNPSIFKRILEDPTVVKYGYGIKPQMKELSLAGYTIGGRVLDVELMHYLIDPEKSHNLDILAKHYLDVSLESNAEGGEMILSLFDDAQSSKFATDYGKEVVVLMQLGPRIWTEMQNAGVVELYEKVEGPLMKVLCNMEIAGVKVNLDTLSLFAQSLRKEVAMREEYVRSLAGMPDLNVSSPKQIGTLLFEKMQLDPGAKKPAKGNWSTDEATLIELVDRSPIIDAILEFREAKKLLSTYIEPFPSYVSPRDGRIHTTFNQALTATGRLSSSNPNLQNIPIRTERGKSIRSAFVAGTPDGFIMSADYSQIELRIMAHLCKDEHLLDAFRNGVDVHAATAAKIFSQSVESVTSQQRRIAKTVNFGIMYGMSAFGLSQRLRISRTEAKKIIDDYFESFPSIRTFIDRTLESAREKGYVETLFGRRRYIPDINANNASLRGLAERNAVNAPIQGTSADIIKIAMIRIDNRLNSERMKSRMILQIHDELLFETCPEELNKLRDIVVSEMENVISLSVPLTVECNYGKNWLEAH